MSNWGSSYCCHKNIKHTWRYSVGQALQLYEGKFWLWKWDIGFHIYHCTRRHISPNLNLHSTAVGSSDTFPVVFFLTWIFCVLTNLNFLFLCLSQIGHGCKVLTTFIILDFYLARSAIRGFELHCRIIFHDMILISYYNFHPCISIWRMYVSFILRPRFCYRIVCQWVSLQCMCFGLIICSC